MKGSRFKIGAVRPNQGVNLGIEPHLIKQVRITKRAIQRSGKYRPEIDFTYHAITENDPKAMWTNNLEVRDAMQSVNHVGTYGSGSIGRGSDPAYNRPQSATNSDCRNSAHASTSLACRRGRPPASSSMGSRPYTASSSP